LFDCCHRTVLLSKFDIVLLPVVQMAKLGTKCDQYSIRHCCIPENLPHSNVASHFKTKNSGKKRFGTKKEHVAKESKKMTAEVGLVKNNPQDR
jgi:hypothetical protein